MTEVGLLLLRGFHDLAPRNSGRADAHLHRKGLEVGLKEAAELILAGQVRQRWAGTPARVASLGEGATCRAAIFASKLRAMRAASGKARREAGEKSVVTRMRR
jgi:hypothetical protein